MYAYVWYEVRQNVLRPIERVVTQLSFRQLVWQANFSKLWRCKPDQFSDVLYLCKPRSNRSDANHDLFSRFVRTRIAVSKFLPRTSRPIKKIGMGFLTSIWGSNIDYKSKVIFCDTFVCTCVWKTCHAHKEINAQYYTFHTDFGAPGNWRGGVEFKQLFYQNFCIDLDMW